MAWSVKVVVAVCSGGSSSSGGLLRGRPCASPGVMRGVVEGVGARGPAVTVCSSRPRVRWGVGRGGIGGPGGVGGGSGAPSPLRPDSASRMVERRLACRDAPRLASTSLNPRERTPTREHVT